MTMNTICTLLVARLLAPLGTLYGAELKLASVFAEHMVLQRDKPVGVWGWADAGETVTVSFAGQSKSATADAGGKWSLKLDALAASAEPRTLAATGKDGRRVELTDVLVGEVWLGSGQSNMEMSVKAANHFAAEQAAANLPLIRYYSDTNATAAKPQAEGKGIWQVCSPATVGRFSATLYFFGREIHREVGVPVGLINASVGATQIEYWIPAEAQSKDPETKANYDTFMRGYTSFDEAKFAVSYQNQLVAWNLAVEKPRQTTRYLRPRPWISLPSESAKARPRVSSTARYSTSHPSPCAASFGIKGRATLPFQAQTKNISTTSCLVHSSQAGASSGKKNCPLPGCNSRTSLLPAKAGRAYARRC